MPFVIDFPAFLHPEIFSLQLGGFTLALRWYALAYIAGFVIGWRLILAAMRRPHWWPHGRAPMTPEQVEALLTWIIVGVTPRESCAHRSVHAADSSIISGSHAKSSMCSRQLRMSKRPAFGGRGKLPGLQRGLPTSVVTTPIR